MLLLYMGERYEIVKKRGYKGIIRRLMNDAIKHDQLIHTRFENRGALTYIVVTIG